MSELDMRITDLLCELSKAQAYLRHGTRSEADRVRARRYRDSVVHDLVELVDRELDFT